MNKQQNSIENLYQLVQRVILGNLHAQQYLGHINHNNFKAVHKHLHKNMLHFLMAVVVLLRKVYNELSGSCP